MYCHNLLNYVLPFTALAKISQNLWVETVVYTRSTISPVNLSVYQNVIRQTSNYLICTITIVLQYGMYGIILHQNTTVVI